MCESFDDPFEVELMLEIATEDSSSLNTRFPNEDAAKNLRHLMAPTVTLDKEVFGGRMGGYAQELITLISFALEGKETYEREEMFI